MINMRRFYLYLFLANQYASASQSLSAAINLRPNYAECYMLLGGNYKDSNPNSFTTNSKFKTL